MDVLLFLIGALVGGAVVAYRLKGDQTWPEVGRAVIAGGGGPKPVK